MIPLICLMFLRFVSDSLVKCTSYVASLMFPFVCVHMDLTHVPRQSVSYQTPSFSLFVIHDKPFVFKYLSLYLLTSGLILLISTLFNSCSWSQPNSNLGLACLTESLQDSALSVPLLWSSPELWKTPDFILCSQTPQTFPVTSNLSYPACKQQTSS